MYTYLAQSWGMIQCTPEWTWPSFSHACRLAAGGRPLNLVLHQCSCNVMIRVAFGDRSVEVEVAENVDVPTYEADEA